MPYKALGYHRFKGWVNSVWKCTSQHFDDVGFDSLMDIINWRLPHNMKVDHYHAADVGEVIRNTVFDAL